MAMRKVWREINDQKASNLSSELRCLQQLAHGTGIVEELSA